jgi:succinyl-CoA synthetase beta subunit
MNIHEYQARDILREHGVPVPPGQVATTPEEAEEIAGQIDGPVVVKAQVHAGGRGKAGGVKLARTADEARYGLLNHQVAAMAYFLYEDSGLARQAARIMTSLYEAYRASGATLAEINPLIVNPAGEVKAIDAKMNIDDNALFRLPAIEALRDVEAENPAETRARGAGLSYIQLDGNVGCCVNGAGLAMATMDLVKYYGGDPANFLDIGGSSNPDKVVAALEIITSDPNVKSILFNIFGGITRCDDVANGIVEATRRIQIEQPIVIRLTGTNEEVALEILKKAGFEAYTSMDAVVEKAVELAKGAA